MVRMRHLPGRTLDVEYSPGRTGRRPGCGRGSTLASDGDGRHRRRPGRLEGIATRRERGARSSRRRRRAGPSGRGRGRASRRRTAKARATFAARSRRSRSNCAVVARTPLERRRRAGARDWWRRPGRCAPPGRIRAAGHARHGPARGRRPRRRRRPATSAWRPPPRAAWRCGSRRAYLIACRASRTTPWNGAHHSSCTSGSGRSPGNPMAPRRRLEPRVEPARADVAEGRSLGGAPDARRRQGEVQGTPGDGPQELGHACLGRLGRAGRRTRAIPLIEAFRADGAVSHDHGPDGTPIVPAPVRTSRRTADDRAGNSVSKMDRCSATSRRLALVSARS